MLDLDDLDLDDLSTALEDNSYEHSWWFDPRSGEVRLHSPGIDEGDVDDLDEAGLVPIHSIAAHEAYSDMEDFVARVGDQRVAARLERALGGPRPFRRFKDELYDHPELREQWFVFNDARMRRRAVEWLVDNGFIEGADAQRAIAQCERQLVEAHTDTSALAARVQSTFEPCTGTGWPTCSSSAPELGERARRTRTSTCLSCSTRSPRPGSSYAAWMSSCGSTPRRVGS